MELPDALAHKIELWNAMGRIPLQTEESYLEPSWVAILTGNGVLPRRYDPLVDRIDVERLKKGMQARRSAIAEAAERLPTQIAYIQRNCAMSETA
jgi:tryptophan halogenase